MLLVAQQELKLSLTQLPVKPLFVIKLMRLQRFKVQVHQQFLRNRHQRLLTVVIMG